MSFVDLATLAFHRRNEMDVRINTFSSKCDLAINGVKKLKTKARSFVDQLNCEPAVLKERFLTCMKLLDEYIYLMTDFNLALAKFEENGSMDMAPVQDTSHVYCPVLNPTNLMDVLSELTPSTPTACQNMCPLKRTKHKRIPKEDQLLIAFSSTSCSAESVPEARGSVDNKVQCVIEKIEDLTIKSPEPPECVESLNLPAQTLLQTDHVYPATIMAIDGPSIWVITGDINEVFSLLQKMTTYYKDHHDTMTAQEIAALTYCVFYDIESEYYYRALFLKLILEPTIQVEVFLVDTGDIHVGGTDCIRRIAPQFCTAPPYARCCHLADVDLVSSHNKELVKKQEEFMKDFIGKQFSMRVDDNTSESLGVYVLIDATTTVNERLVQEGLALTIDKPPPPAATSAASQGSSASAPQFDISQDPEFTDPVQAVTGYSNRDEMDICKHYKGNPDKTCFKGARCQKRHVFQHPDGWTLDRVPVSKCKAPPLPAPNSWHRVLVTCVCHFDRICVQIVTNPVKEDLPSFGVVLPPMTLEALVRDMNSPAARIAYKTLELAPAPGELVAALYPPDNQWYRARVISSTRADQSVEVIYIDYGNEVWVKEDAIRALEPRFLGLPAQAVRCRLAGVAPLSNNSKNWAATKAALTEMTQDKTLNMRVISRQFDEISIEIFDEEGFSVVEQLEARGLIALEEFEVTDDSNVTFQMGPV